jgi:alpha-D-xyloside xylohydrolase
VDQRSENYAEMLEKGYLVRAERGARALMLFMGVEAFFDATNPGAREFVWSKAKQNYYDKGIHIFWLDEAEPEYSAYDYDNYRYHLGPVLQVGNLYPVKYAQTFYEGMAREGQKDILNLIRCAWAGSQRFGTLLWSGDIDTTFESLRNQLAIGLTIGLSGIPWWTTDIGGFSGGDQNDPAYRELLIRWFQFGAFCPVFRLHGDRKNGIPWDNARQIPGSGGPNEVWSYGEQAYDILSANIRMRERMLPYIAELMREAHEKGAPPMRPVFYDFPKDNAAWSVEDEFMFGPDVLVAPILSLGQRKRQVYLPAGARWKQAYTGKVFEGGQTVEADAPLERLPVFIRDGKELPIA